MATFSALLVPLTCLAAVGSGLIGGVFFAFSTFVMRALARLPAADGMAAMRSINVAVINPLFLTPFVGTALLALVTAAGAVLRWDRPGSGWALAGAVLYVLGTFGVTVAFNVPLNDALAKVAATDPAAAAHWAAYVSRWTLWNHVRTGAALAACLAYILSLRQ